MRCSRRCGHRRHYGTTGPRIFLDLHGAFEQSVTGFLRRPQTRACKGIPGARSMHGRHHPTGRSYRCGLSVEVIGTAPVERVDVLHGTQVAQTVRPYAAADLGRRVRVLWQGAEYRGRGRETIWQGKLTLTGNRITRFAPVNFLNPERKIEESHGRYGANMEFGDDRQSCRHRSLARRGTPRHAQPRDQRRIGHGGSRYTLLTTPSSSRAAALTGSCSVYRLPEADWSRGVVARPHK